MRRRAVPTHRAPQVLADGKPAATTPGGGTYANRSTGAAAARLASPRAAAGAGRAAGHGARGGPARPAHTPARGWERRRERALPRATHARTPERRRALPGERDAGGGGQRPREAPQPRSSRVWAPTRAAPAGRPARRPVGLLDLLWPGAAARTAVPA